VRWRKPVHGMRISNCRQLSIVNRSSNQADFARPVESTLFRLPPAAREVIYALWTPWCCWPFPCLRQEASLAGLDNLCTAAATIFRIHLITPVQQLSLDCGPAAVDHQVDAVDISRGLGRKKDDRALDVFPFKHSSYRNATVVFLHERGGLMVKEAAG